MSVVYDLLKKIKRKSDISKGPGTLISPEVKKAKGSSSAREGSYPVSWKILGVIFAAVVLLNTLALFYFYKKSNESIVAFRGESGIISSRIETLERNSETFRNIVETINSQLKKYEQDTATLAGRMSSGEANVNELLAKLDAVNRSLDDWQKKYENITAVAMKTEVA